MSSSNKRFTSYPGFHLPFISAESVFSVALAEKRIARVYSFKGMPLVDVREVYTDKTGHAQPSRKGISLTLDQFKSLSASAAQITECMERLTKREGAESGAAASGGAGAAGLKPAKASGGADADDDGGEGLAGSELTVPLSEKRVARVYTFKGIVMVDVREMWKDAAGTLKPTKKGAHAHSGGASNCAAPGYITNSFPRRATLRSDPPHVTALCLRLSLVALYRPLPLLLLLASASAGISLRVEQFKALVTGSANIVRAMEDLAAGKSASSSSGPGSSSSASGGAGAQSSKGGNKAARLEEVDYGC